ncbi:MAG: hypothetical protein ACLQSR_18765 [Limisphaerales bacterium]
MKIVILPSATGSGNFLPVEWERENALHIAVKFTTGRDDESLFGETFTQ